MKFQDKFKPCDIICSDRFHNGLFMVVEYGKTSPLWGNGESLFLETNVLAIKITTGGVRVIKFN